MKEQLCTRKGPKEGKCTCSKCISWDLNEYFDANYPGRTIAYTILVTDMSTVDLDEGRLTYYSNVSPTVGLDMMQTYINNRFKDRLPNNKNKE